MASRRSRLRARGLERTSKARSGEKSQDLLFVLRGRHAKRGAMPGAREAHESAQRALRSVRDSLLQLGRHPRIVRAGDHQDRSIPERSRRGLEIEVLPIEAGTRVRETKAAHSRTGKRGSPKYSFTWWTTVCSMLRKGLSATTAATAGVSRAARTAAPAPIDTP